MSDMRLLTPFLSLLVLLICSVPMLAQSAELQTASEFARQGRWKEASAAYQAAVAANDGDGAAWMGLGEAQLQQSQFPEAKASFGKAAALGFRPVMNRVNLARVGAKAGESAAVYNILRALNEDGLAGTARPIVLNSTEFSEMLHSEAFRRFVQTEMAPCRATIFHDFDFWIGDWKVLDPDGNLVGENVVTAEQDGCLLVEHWKASGAPQTGSSFNYFDIRDKKWHQLYIDNSGNAGAFPAMSGRLENGRMVLLTDPAVKPMSRWTWYALSSDKVRQMAEQSLDGGQTWRTTWDSVYVRKTQ